MSADVTANRIKRLMDAVEGECEGLAITDAQAVAILSHVDHAADTLEPEVEAIVARYAASIDGRAVRGVPEDVVRAHLREFLGAAGSLYTSPAPGGEAAQGVEPVADLRAALDKYGRHKDGCVIARALPFERRGGGLKCTCGFDAARGLAPPSVKQEEATDGR